MERGHWCFNHEKYMQREVLERTCKVKGHDIDYEDTYHPPSRVKCQQPLLMRIKL